MEGHRACGFHSRLGYSLILKSNDTENLRKQRFKTDVNQRAGLLLQAAELVKLICM